MGPQPGPPLLELVVRAPLGRAAPPGRALWATPQRAPGAQVGRHRRRGADGPHRRGVWSTPAPNLVWTTTKNAHSRRTIPIDATTADRLAKHRCEQLEERLLAGGEWEDNDLVVCTKLGRPIIPRNFDQTLRRVVAASGMPKLTSHGLRHTAATRWCARPPTSATSVRSADVLGHSPDMLMRVYAHALPDAVRAVADRIGCAADGPRSCSPPEVDLA
jgi:Phage integrase family